MPSKYVTVKIDITRSVKKSLEKLAKKRILIGVPEGPEHKRDPFDTEPPMTNAQIGYLMEFGSPSQRIPARPHLVPAVTQALPKITKRFQSAAKATLTGNDKECTRQLNACGIETMTAVKNMINSNIPPKLAPFTIAKRLAKGITRTNTLVDTGEYRNSQTYIVEEK